MAVFDGSADDVTVMFALPAVIARTSPVDDTVAIAGALLLQSTLVFVAPVTVAVSCCVPPGCSETVDGATPRSTVVCTAPASARSNRPTSPAVALVAVRT